MESFGRYVRAGVNMGIGTDTFPPDIIEEMRMGAIINKIVEGATGSAGNRSRLLQCSDYRRGEGVGSGGPGSAEAAGCTADISIFDFSHLTAAPMDDPLRMLVHAANARDCHTVLVGGEVVVESGRCRGG